MEEKYLSLTLAVDMFIITLLALVLFRGRIFTDYLCVIQNTHIVVTVLICVVCIGCFLRFFINSRNIPANKPMVFSIIESIFWLICGVVFFHILCILYGAPVLTSVQETFSFSCLLSFTTIFPSCCTLGPDTAAWYRVFCKNCSENSTEISVRLSTIGSILGAWFGAFPIPLDWDRPWQVWPISCVIGTVIGYSVGLILSHVQIYRRQAALSKLKLG